MTVLIVAVVTRGTVGLVQGLMKNKQPRDVTGIAPIVQKSVTLSIK